MSPEPASNIQLPKGAKIYLPDEAARKRWVEERLLRVCTAWGYREIEIGRASCRERVYVLV